jgi:hypothetical protein
MKLVQSGPAQTGGRTDGQLKIQKIIRSSFFSPQRLSAPTETDRASFFFRSQRQTTQCNPAWSSADAQTDRASFEQTTKFEQIDVAIISQMSDTLKTILGRQPKFESDCVGCNSQRSKSPQNNMHRQWRFPNAKVFQDNEFDGCIDCIRKRQAPTHRYH